jgi:16S rRNA (adenine1518-N6/adenine1519-N6)-dimethyltransferase
MVQREVGERLAAGAGTKAYGATSAIAQLSCDVRVLRRVPATVFHPAPNVVSALVLLRRVAPAPPRAVIDLIHAAFAHRRKALAGSLALAPGGSAELRDRARAALAELGHPSDVRAERLAPQDFARLADSLGWPER